MLSFSRSHSPYSTDASLMVKMDMAPQAVHMFPTLPDTSQPPTLALPLPCQDAHGERRARKEELLIKDEREVEMEASN